MPTISFHLSLFLCVCMCVKFSRCFLSRSPILWKRRAGVLKVCHRTLAENRGGGVHKARNEERRIARAITCRLCAWCDCGSSLENDKGSLSEVAVNISTDI